MKKVISCSVVLFHVIVICASELSENDTEKSIENSTRLKEENCASFSTPSPFTQYIELDNVADVRPAGYKVKLQFSIAANNSVAVVLSPIKDNTTSHYEIHFKYEEKEIWILRSAKKVANVKFISSMLADVVIAVTYDNILAVIVGGKTLVTYSERYPFAINYFALLTHDEARFFYICKADSSNNAMDNDDAHIRDLITELEIERRILGELKRTDCSSFRTQSTKLDYFEMDNLVDARRAGFKVNFPISIVLNKTAVIILSSTKDETMESYYEFRFNNWNNDTRFYRNHREIVDIQFSSSEVADVIIAMSDDDMLSVVVNGKTLLTYSETKPFVINYFGLSISSEKNDEETFNDARFFYNCKSRSSNDNETSRCGKRKINRQPLLTSILRTNEGDWPWHAAIWHTQGERRSYMCGGTLISSDAVLTAAHCLYEFGHLIVRRRIIVSLGKHDLLLTGPNTQEFRAHQSIIHNGFNRDTLQNDIAIIRLATEPTFTAYVQPICLWDVDQMTSEEIFGRNGIVVGWGLNEQDKLPEALEQAFMPVISNSDCRTSDAEFFGTSLFDGTFCAGFRNGTSVCNGDSGGGMYFVKNELYTLRGIVSQTKARDKVHNNYCDSQSYVIFTDTAYYLNWIKENMK